VDSAASDEYDFLKDRLAKAREFLETIDVFQLISEWRLPEER
jgi:hypothetical protein